MMLVVSAVTAGAIYFAERSAGLTVAHELERRFQAELDALHNMQEIRQAVLVERCRTLVRKPRLHAALEDGALDLLYPNAEDELRDIMADAQELPAAQTRYALQALFYRFLNRYGAVITPPNMDRVGSLLGEDAARLTLPTVPEQMQFGYLVRQSEPTNNTVSEVIAMPIFSSETGEVIAAIVLGFKPINFGHGDLEIKSGLWLDGKLWLAPLSSSAQMAVSEAVEKALSNSAPERPFEIALDHTPCFLFFKRLNPGSLFPPAYEVCIYPLTELAARQKTLRLQIGGVGLLFLVGGFIASNFVSIHLSRPVEKLEHDSAENLEQRKRVEAVLDLTSEELQRSIRFSADASHQLKTPVTVLRAGLEELLVDEKLKPAVREEISALVYQTVKLTSIIEDLLLLSRVDAGHLQIEFGPVNLVQLIEGWLDDLGALPDPFSLSIETDLPATLMVDGEKRYTSLIVQNLLENARKYNQPKGRIRITARVDNVGRVFLVIGNTGHSIPLVAQGHIFERFHRGVVGENVPGHGLGLNLARELAHLHHGELRLVGSTGGWTEFEVTFLAAKPQTVSGFV